MMKNISSRSVLLLLLLSFGDFCLSDPLTNESAGPIQIVVPVNHTLRLELDALQHILEADDIKDRHVVVVSIAGAFRQGKSFLLNFFIKYLSAQYKTHNVSDWLGEKENRTELNGFKWRFGRRPETIGIWIWSEIFTHDYDTGEKVAIVLVDTQGIFDSQSSIKDCTTTFALSTLLSSLQCYNLMQSIGEDSLQHLEFFTEYGRLALEQANEKPFQYLLFIVRDWPFQSEINYGLSEAYVNETFEQSPYQTTEMRQLRVRIQSSFDEIGAFLMPHPGFAVSRGNFDGDIQNIDPDFRKYLKQLAPAIFAPERLIIKKVYGQKLRARDLVQYWQKYVDIFNGDALPEPRSILEATAQTHNQIMFNDYLNLYIRTMEQQLNEVDPFSTQSELLAMHSTAKEDYMSQLHAKPTLGGDQQKLNLKLRLDKAIEEQFSLLQQKNNEKQKNFLNDKVKAIVKTYQDIGFSRVNNQDSYIFQFGNFAINLQNQAVAEFDQLKVGAISGVFRDKLIQDLNSYIHSTLRLQNQWKNDREDLRREAQRNKAEYDAIILNQNNMRSNRFGLLGAIAGGILGFLAGGPPGAAAGATAGGGLTYYVSTQI